MPKASFETPDGDDVPVANDAVERFWRAGKMRPLPSS
jgi:hypothetical protein